MLKKLTSADKPIQFQGGCITSRDPALLPFGAYSMVQNMRNIHPGFEKRAGQIKLHTLPYSTNRGMSLYQFKKNRVSESHFFAQWSDGDVQEADTAPPGVTTGEFATAEAYVFNGTGTGQYPASWSVIDDMLVYSNGVDQHQVYAGDSSYIEKFIVFKGSAVPGVMPPEGVDYSTEVRDGGSSVAILDSLKTYLGYNCIFVKTPVPVKSLTFTIPAPNGNVATLGVKYWNGAWTNVSGLSDGTSSASKTFATTGGTVAWTEPTTIIPRYLYGQNGYWYMLFLSDISSNASLKDEDCADITDWDDDDSGDGASTDGTGDYAGMFKLDSGTAGDANDASRSLDVGTLGNRVVVEVKLYHATLGTNANKDRLRLIVNTDDCRLLVSFATDGLYVYDGAAYNEVGTNIVATTTWQTWVFDIDFTTAASATVDVYLDGVIQNTADVDASDTGSYTDGDIILHSEGDATANIITYVDYIKVGAGTANALDAEVEVSAVTFDSSWQNVENIWDGIPIDVAEIQFYDASATTPYYTFSPAAAEIDSATSSDKIYFACADPIVGFYVDVGETPNTTGSTTVNAVYYWDGDGFTAATIKVDGTDGLSHSGWVIIARQTDVEATQFNKSQYHAYWYYFTVDQTLNDDVIIGIQTMPYFAMSDYGTAGQCTCPWKHRMVYTFNEWAEYLYISRKGLPFMWSGFDSAILEAGDGRSNRIVAARKYYNELMVWQEEKGVEGGCLTLFEGYTPGTFGRLVLNDRVGTMNNQSVAIVPGVMTATRTDETIKTLAFFLSRYGVCVSDGRSITIISDDIQNYFDPAESECIRYGDAYTKRMWLKHDSARNAILTALITGTARSTSTATSTTSNKLTDTEAAFTTDGTAVGDTVSNTTDSTTALVTAIDSATALSIDTDIMASGESYGIYAGTPNVFPVFDLADKTWSFDDRAQELACFEEIEAASGNVPVLQVGAGVDDGTVYLLNSGLNDVSTEIDSYVLMQLGNNGSYINLREVALRCEAQAAGNIILTVTKNSLAAFSKTLSMLVEVTSQTIRRNRFRTSVTDQNIALKIQHATASQNMKLYDIALETKLYSGR